MDDRQSHQEDDKEKTIPVILLCGGKGTRLREETEFKPKPLVEIGGHPIMWHIMKGYATHGYNRFILCLGYKGDLIKEYFKDMSWRANDFRLQTVADHVDILGTNGILGEDWDITFADTGLSSLTGRRLKLVEKYIDTDEFMLTYGDGVSDVDIQGLVDFHREQGTLVTITGHRPRSKYGVLNLDGNKVTEFREKPILDNFINGGFMIMKREVLDRIGEDENTMLVDDLLPKLAKEGQVSLFPHDGFWHCMDTFKDYKDLNALWESDPKWKNWE